MLSDREKESKEKRKKWESIVVVTVIGYLIGVLITVLWFVYLSHKLHCSLKKAKWIKWTITGLIALIMFYSRHVRCTSLLTIPILCSSKGRSLTIAAAFVLATTGPTVNTMRNVNVLMESLSCGQEQLKEALKGVMDIVKKPLVAVKNAVRVVMQELKKVLKKVKEVMLKIKEIVVLLLAGIKEAFNWLGSIVSMCNKTLGTPFDRCMRLADEAMKDCEDKMSIMKSLCSVTKVLNALCYSVKFIDVLCILVEFVSDSIVGTVMEKLRLFNEEIKMLLDVSITFDHDFEFETTASRNLSEVGAEVMAEINNRMNRVIFVFGWCDILGSLFLALVVLKALFYKSKYMKSNTFDNLYITKDFEDVNEQRMKMNRELALPLTRSEKGTYVRLSSCKLTRPEVFKMAKSMMFLTVSTIQLFSICFCDYSLYWLLNLININGRLESGIEVPPFITVNMSGSGFVRDIFEGIVHAFEPITVSNYTVDPKVCLPVPKVPNYNRYMKIGGLVLLAWLFVVLQPYALRMRQVVMRYFYPERAMERALWLYSQVLLRRISFVKMARRVARNKFLKDDSADKFSCMDWIRANTNRYRLGRMIFGRGSLELCKLCATPLKGEEDTVKCQSVGCQGTYCKDCYSQLNNICCLCSSPIDYGDLSDISEEKDSSDEFEGVQTDRNDIYCK